jgi:uncharacterized membrane protein YjjP (DUF1212 family)
LEINEIKLLKTIKLAAQIILENGGETYRAEETIKYICNSFNVYDIESIATPTGFYITINSEKAESKTIVKRINKRTINLQKINDVNEISRQLSLHSISLNDALQKLNKIEYNPEEHDKFSLYYPAISSAFFTLLFGGGILEFFTALFTVILVTLISRNFENLHSSQFFSAIISGSLIAIIAILITYVTGIGNYNYIIVGCIMPLLPGLAMTNAIRDTIRGDLISGTARATEAILVASSLAAGAGVIIYIAYSTGILVS